MKKRRLLGCPMVKVYDAAPDFKAISTKGEVELSKVLSNSGSHPDGGGGKWAVLFFYSGDFTSVCSTEVPGFARRYEEFRGLNAEVLGGSGDSIYSHRAWISRMEQKVEYPLISDFKKDLCRAYDILDEKSGEPLRGNSSLIRRDA